MSARARRNDVVRRLRTVAVRAVRRHGLLPTGLPDRYGEDDALLGTRLDETVLLYFGGTQQDIYQLQQWYGPVRALHERHPVVVVTLDSRTTRRVRAELGLRVLTIANYGTLDDLLSRSDVKLALYVGHQPLNFNALRFTSLVHVFLNHGDSDKAVAVSNQCKAYDLLFVPGQASIDRMARHTVLYDAAARCWVVGRPQLDFDRVEPPPRRGERSVVLYAPTWEGAQPSVAYGSVVTHGPRLARALVADHRFTLVYRPHPLSGVTDRRFGDADAEVRRLITDAAAAEPGAGHRVETAASFNALVAEGDVLVCDVSAVAIDWLPSGKPFVVTRVPSPVAVDASTRMLEVIPRLPVEELGRVGDLLAEQLDPDPDRVARLALVDYYLGDTSPGAATRRFLDACSAAIELRDREWAAARARGAKGP